MFNKIAHEQSLPRSSASSLTPGAAAQQPCSQSSRIAGRVERGKLRKPIQVACYSSRRSSYRKASHLSCRAEALQLDVRHPVAREAAAFAPATIANLGPGFDWMGCAVEVAVPITCHLSL